RRPCPSHWLCDRRRAGLAVPKLLRQPFSFAVRRLWIASARGNAVRRGDDLVEYDLADRSRRGRCHLPAARPYRGMGRSDAGPECRSDGTGASAKPLDRASGDLRLARKCTAAAAALRGSGSHPHAHGGSAMKRALITGITGQDGSYLAELLLDKGYEVFGFARQDSWYRANCASHLAGRIELLFGDVVEGIDLANAIRDAEPDEIYNLASQSRPGESWARAPETLMVNGLAAVRLFEAVRHGKPDCRIYHASSSEM